MDIKLLAHTYLYHLEAGDVTSLVGMFAPDGQVDSPLFGTLPARVFYPKLAEQTRESHLVFNQVFQDLDNSRCFALRFTYHWALADGRQKSFDCVDIITTNGTGLFTNLTIIYDTHPRLE